jgi:transposase
MMGGWVDDGPTESGTGGERRRPSKVETLGVAAEDGARPGVAVADHSSLRDGHVEYGSRSGVGRDGSNRLQVAWSLREKGVAGLLDEPRSGVPRKISDDQVEAVIVKTLESTPRDATHWSTRSMAAATGLSRPTINRIWRAFGLQPHRTETFKLSPDPQLVEKVRDIVGPAHPANASGPSRAAHP